MNRKVYTNKEKLNYYINKFAEHEKQLQRCSERIAQLSAEIRIEEVRAKSKPEYRSPYHTHPYYKRY